MVTRQLTNMRQNLKKFLFFRELIFLSGLLLSITACNGNEQQISEQNNANSMNLSSNYDWIEYYANQSDSLMIEESIAMHNINERYDTFAKNLLVEEFNTWKILRKELSDFYFLLVGSPRWYAGSEGIIEYHAGVRDITSLHLAMYKEDLKGAPDTLNRYFAPAISLEIFTDCCQSALDTTIPTEPDSAYAAEQNDELHQCYQSASASLSRIKVKARQWVEVRNRIADSVDSVAIIDPDYWTRPEYINCNTSNLLIELAKLVSSK